MNTAYQRLLLSLIWFSLSCPPIFCGESLGDESQQEEWLTPGVAVERSVTQMKPLLIVLELDSDDESKLQIEKLMSDSAIQKSLSQVLWIKDQWERVGDRWVWNPLSDEFGKERIAAEQGARKRLEKLLNASGGKTVVAVFDPYLEKGTLLQSGKLRSSTLRKAIRASIKLATTYERTRKITLLQVDKAQGFVQDSKHPQALQILTEEKFFKFPAVEPLLNRRDQLLEILHERWKEARFKAREMERSNQLAEAAAELEKILKEFPHPDWEKQIREDIGRVWRRIQGPGSTLNLWGIFH